MKNFKWLLNWSVANISVMENDNIFVMKNGRNIGRCHISFESDNIVGEFNLTEELDNSEYVLYMISKPNILNEIYLEGIMLVDHYDGSKAIKAESMQVM
jgi:hypothetical protein